MTYQDVPTVGTDSTNNPEPAPVSAEYINDEELEAWLKDRFGPRHLFNRQLARDLLDWGVRVALERAR